MTEKDAKAKDKALATMKAAVPEVAEILRLLAHPVRLLLLCEISRGESSVSALERTLGIRQPGLSQQLAELRQSGLVETRRQAKSVFYRIADARIKTLLDSLYAIFCEGAPTPPAVAQPTEASDVRPHQRSIDTAKFARVERHARIAEH